jgi:SAM-dependent methyltransferase
MNAFEHFFCSSRLWRVISERQLLPWVLSGAQLGDHVLEIGAGYGAATPYLNERVAHITSLEYDRNVLLRMKSRNGSGARTPVQGDGARLPFTGATFSSAVAILVLHHLKSVEQQDQMFAEVFRALRPGGVFLAFEIGDTLLNRAIHLRSTFTPLAPGSVFARLTAAGFSKVSVDFRRAGFRLTAVRPKGDSDGM